MKPWEKVQRIDQHHSSRERKNKWGFVPTFLISHRENPEEEGVKFPHVACDVCQLGIKLLQVADKGAKVLSYVHSALLVCQNVLQIGGCRN